MMIKDLFTKYGEFIRFCCVGVLSTSIDVAIFYAVRLFASYPVALVSGYVISLIVNYFITIYWTFKSTPNTRNAFGIVVAHLFNLFIVRMGLMYLFVDVFLMNDRLAYIPTLVISVVTNFIIVRFVVKYCCPKMVHPTFRVIRQSCRA